jgi:nucleotide-binding universal stress UspA family protein
MQPVKQAEEASRTWAQEYLERVAAGVRERGIPVQTKIIEGRPHSGITEYAETNQVDLIVMCTRGQSGLSRWLMGSVADRVVRGADVPVLLVHARKEK